MAESETKGVNGTGTAQEGRAESVQWQAIRGCPKSGERFLAYATLTFDEFDEEGMLTRAGAKERYCVVAYYLFGSVVSFPFTGGVPQNVQYTHWMPLPAPPSPSPAS